MAELNNNSADFSGILKVRGGVISLKFSLRRDPFLTHVHARRGVTLCSVWLGLCSPSLSKANVHCSLSGTAGSRTPQ
jgi:hypothetical protein